VPSCRSRSKSAIRVIGVWTRRVRVRVCRGRIGRTGNGTADDRTRATRRRRRRPNLPRNKRLRSHLRINQRIRVIRLDAESPDALAKVGEEGQVIADLLGDEAFEGYWRRPDADARALRQGWYLTGETGYIEGDGDLYVTGRIDDMIITGGENVSPGEIENVLSLHPAIAEVAVAGLPDERLGRQVTAFVKRSVAIDAASLDVWCRASPLADFKRPRDWVFVAEIPKSPVGKVLRRKLIAGEYERGAQ
jgi:2-furoate---CoA ligase